MDLAALADETAFERLVLEKLHPLIPRLEASSVIDARGPRESLAVTPAPANIVVTVIDGTEPVDLAILQPLAFGAAWKVLDLLMEKASGKRQIDAKQVDASARQVPPPAPWSQKPDEWHRISLIYAATVRLRHSLVHRQLEFDQHTGEIRGTGKGQGLPMSATEQAAFCRICLATIEATLAGRISERELGQVQWLLNELASHHGLANLTPNSSFIAGVVPLLKVNLEVSENGTVEVDRSALVARGQRNVVTDHFDVEGTLDDATYLRFKVEDAPTQAVEIDLANLPDWVTRAK